jgi:hypothetical protein
MKTFICLFGFITTLLMAIELRAQSLSVMHQIYGGIYGIIAAIFLCTGLIIETIEPKKTKQKNKDDRSSHFIKLIQNYLFHKNYKNDIFFAFGKNKVQKIDLINFL